MARFNIAKAGELVIQGVARGHHHFSRADLAVGTGDAAVQAGDSVEVRYTGWLLKDGAVGKVCIVFFLARLIAGV